MIPNDSIAVRARRADGLSTPSKVSGWDVRIVGQRARLMIREFWRKAVQMGRLIIGVPDYDTYVEHLRRFHPDRVPMTYEEFFIERQNARYKGGGGRCC